MHWGWWGLYVSVNLVNIGLVMADQILSTQAPSHYLNQSWLNSLRPRPNRRHFADDIFKCIFENENEWISARISLKFVPKVQINNIPALVQIMAWRRPGDKPLSEPTLVSLLTHICVTRPQWVKVNRILRIKPNAFKNVKSQYAELSLSMFWPSWERWIYWQPRCWVLNKWGLWCHKQVS